MIKRSAIKIYKYALGYKFDQQLCAFRKITKEDLSSGIAPIHAELPPRMIPKPPALTPEEISDKLRRAKIHFGNVNRMFKKRIAKFRRKK